MHTWNRNRIARLCGLALVFVFFSVEATAAPTNTIDKIAVEETDTHTDITIQERTLHRSLFSKLEDPVRLFVDMPNTDVSKVDGTLAIRNGVVDHIGTLQFKKVQLLLGGSSSCLALMRSTR